MARRNSFAVKPDEPVASLALVSTIMPRGAGDRPRTYQGALAIALVIALGAAIFGAMPVALIVAAFAIPLVYIVYLYDVNLWEDQPIPVVGRTFVLTLVLAAAWTWAWQHWMAPRTSYGFESARISLWGVLLFALVVPLVGEVIRQLGPVWQASSPKFDDLMDGLTFGVTSGVAYACAETLVTQWDLLQVGFAGSAVDPMRMSSLIFLHGFVKPLLYGTASGLAAAEFSGLGKGYDGFTARYLRAFLWAVLAVGLFTVGIYLFSLLRDGGLSLILSIVLGVAITAVLILRIRTVLHVGLMEAAMESAARHDGGVGDGELSFCARCEMPLYPGAAFCNACGVATRASGRPRQQVPAMAGAAAPGVAPRPGAPGAEGEQPAPGADAGDVYHDRQEGQA